MPIPEPYLSNQKRIGSRLIELESHQPGLVRMRPNPLLVPAAAMDLKTLGFKKRFLQSPQQFIFDCVLSYQQAINALLPLTFLVGPDLGDGHFHCWNGCGQYAGWQGLFQLSDFASGGKDRMLLIINIEPFFGQLSDLLDPVPEGAGLAKKPIPAPDQERHPLVRNLIRHRLQSEPLGQEPIPSNIDMERLLPAEFLKQTSEFSILYIAEQYYGVRDNSSDEATAIQRLNEMHTAYLSRGGLALPAMEPPFTLPHYVRHYLGAGFSSGERLSDAFICDALQMISAFYNRKHV